MKSKFILPFLIISLLNISCKDNQDEIENNSGTASNATETQKWIEKTMREHYYWYQSIPESSKLDYSNKTEDFFTSLLSNKDGKDYKNSSNKADHYYYSYIQNISESTRSSIDNKNSYGFEYTGIYVDQSYTQLYALVLYVVKGSPADNAGLKRGDWITKINSNNISYTDFISLASGSGISLSIAHWSEESHSLVPSSEKCILSASTAVEDNPVLAWNIIESPIKKKKIGYLAYTQFERGKTDDDSSYDDKLKELSGSYFTGVDEFVLDLRYNNGGLLSSAVLLCTMFEPASVVGKLLGYLKYNDKTSPIKEYIYTGKDILGSTGKNLDLKTIYILVSNNTASASEMVINCLRPYMNVVVIGEQTEGKNVGSVTYTSDDKKWEMHPIVCQIYNSQDYTDYASGFSPDLELNEAFEYVNENTVNPVVMYDLGDINERMLKAAINIIDGNGYSISRSRGLSTTNNYSFKKSFYSSINRKATNGVIIDR
ncbi:PDZ domain-containing protein [Bacteroidaceae bacterium HV4-6-C5C]|jgi:Periplasmic protease|nr:PDZ domain-containing protein [Bacteroidaceae bacterium HV4-6-C5C]